MLAEQENVAIGNYAAGCYCTSGDFNIAIMGLNAAITHAFIWWKRMLQLVIML